MTKKQKPCPQCATRIKTLCARIRDLEKLSVKDREETKRLRRDVEKLEQSKDRGQTAYYYAIDL